MSDTNAFIHHIAIAAPAEVLKEVAIFYDRILGLKPGYRPNFGGVKGQWLYSGENPIIHLMENSSRDETRSGYFDHVALRCDNLGDVISKLESNNIKYGQIEMQDLNQVQLFMKDPSGTMLELNFENKV
ncbi:MAG: glyoxalase [Moraxellaceae bacterium]|nr:MAG: glyoxalase [Moraxellaceae bacterium]